MSIKELLPIGSVVLLKEGEKRLMIFGVKQMNAEGKEKGKEYDYIGVLYPEGHIGSDNQYLFNHEDIDTIFFRGYEDTERVEFIQRLSEVYGE